jgi:hypothetical protein
LNEPLRIDHGDLLAQGIQNRNIEIRSIDNIHQHYRSVGCLPSDDTPELYPWIAWPRIEKASMKVPR